MGDFHNVIISVVDEQKDMQLTEHIEQLIFHSPVFVLWSGKPSKSTLQKNPTQEDFIPAAHKSIYISGGHMGSINYDREGNPLEIENLNDYMGENLYRGLSFVRQPFKKKGRFWNYSPKIKVAQQFSKSPYEEEASHYDYEELNYIGLFHVLLPKSYVPHTPSIDNFRKQQGILYANKHNRLGRISVTWGFYKNLDLEIMLEKSEKLFEAFDANEYMKPTNAQKLDGVAKATKNIVANDKLGLGEFMKEIIKEGIIKGGWTHLY